jgi:hypothetical protein
MCWPHVNPVPSGAVGKDCQRRLLIRPRFVRAVAPRIIIIIIIITSNKTSHFTIIKINCLTLTNSLVQEPEGSSPHSQQPANSPCSEPVESNPPHPVSQRFILIPSSHLRLDLPSGLFPSGFPTNTCLLWELYKKINIKYRVSDC